MIKELEAEEVIEPETIRAFNPGSSSLEVQKILVENVIKKTHAPFVDFYVFDKVVHILNDMEPSEDSLDGATPEMIWQALEKIQKILGEEFELSYEVKEYIKFIYKDNGFLFYPPLSGIENPFFEEVKKRAKDTPIKIDENNPDASALQAIKYLKILEYIN